MTVDELTVNEDIDVESSVIDEVVAEDSDNEIELENTNEDNLTDDEGEFVDPSEGYAYLNAFRTEEGVWQWNNDDATKTVFNTNSTNQLKPLIIDSALEETAKTRAKEMAEAGVMSHTRPNGDDCWTAFPDGLWAKGENIAKGQTSWKQVTETWKETNYQYSGQGHRRNMLNSNFNSVGIAGYKLNGVIYWAQDFGKYSNVAELNKINPNDAYTIVNNTANPIFSIELPTDAIGNFSVRIDGAVIDSKVLSNGKATITSSDLSTGLHEAILSYSGDSNYYSINQIFNINVAQSENPINPSPTDNTTGTFTDLNNLIQNTNGNSVIKLDKDYTYDNNTDYDFIGGITINKAITIDGQGHTLNANNLARIFTISNNQALLKNIMFINGHSGEGGAVYGSCSVINSTFINNTANMGGAISTSGSVINSTFINNTGVYSGAIYSWSSVSVINSTFIKNTAKYSAGAIYSLRVSIVNSTFIKNTATYGGALYFTGGKVSIINSTFIKNTARSLGGAICCYGGSNTSIVNSTFINNNANSAGAISTYTLGNISVVNSTFINNTSYNEVIHADNDLSVLNSTFINNTGDKNGVSINGNNGLNVSINRPVYGNITVQVNNKEYSSALKDNSTVIDLDNIEVSKKYDVILTFITDNNNKFIIYDNIFVNKTLYDDNGNFKSLNYLIQNTKEGETLKLTRNYKYDNWTDYDFIGGVDINKTIIIDGQGHILDGNNIAGILSIRSINVVIKNIYFINGKSADGGAVFCGGKNISIVNSTFINNTAERGGALSFWHGSAGSVVNSTFINNTDRNYGGAIFNYCGDVSVLNSIFIGNVARYIGGAISSCGGRTSVVNSTFIKNGVAIYSYNRGSTPVVNSTFINNTGDKNGVSINGNNGLNVSINRLVYGNITVQVNNKEYSSALKDNSTVIDLDNIEVSKKYDVILTFITDNNNTYIIYDNIFVNKTSYNDNGNFKSLNYLIQNTKEGETLKLTRNYKYDNWTDYDFIGGVDINKTIIIDGQGHTINADKKARIFNINNKKVILKNINLINGKTTSQGSAIINNGGTIMNCTFINNSAQQGGAIDNPSGSIVDCTFINNSANNAGAIDNQGSGSVVNCTFINNHASWCGAINNQGSASVVNCTFISNSANDCGAIGSNVLVANCIFINNSAIRNGAIGRYAGSVVNCTFINNSDDKYKVNINGDNGLNVTINRLVYDNITVQVNNKKYSSALKDNSTVIDLDNIEASKNYDVILKFITDNNNKYIIYDNIFINKTSSQNNMTSNNDISINITHGQNGENTLIIKMPEYTNKNITVVVDGVVYNVTVHEGIGILTINNTVPKQNNNDFTNNTNTNINTNTNNTSQNTNTHSQTKKQTPIITAKKATFKAKKKSKKYTIILKAGKKAVNKVTVYLKIAKKTFKATTKSNGKAIFNIKLNKKGKYSATITFKGNQNYNKATKKVKIVIK